MPRGLAGLFTARMADRTHQKPTSPTPRCIGCGRIHNHRSRQKQRATRPFPRERETKVQVLNWQASPAGGFRMTRKPRPGNYPPPCATQEAWACCSSPLRSAPIFHIAEARRHGNGTGGSFHGVASPVLGSMNTVMNPAARLSLIFGDNVWSGASASATLWPMWCSTDWGTTVKQQQSQQRHCAIFSIIAAASVPVSSKHPASTLLRARFGLVLQQKQSGRVV